MYEYIRIFFKGIIKDGFVPDTTFERLNFPSGRGITGKIVHWTITIAQESRQRAKILTHVRQETDREVQLIEKNVKESIKVETVKKMMLAKLDLNKECI